MAELIITAAVIALAWLSLRLAYDVGRQEGRRDCASDVERADRYRMAVDDLDRWCGHESPHARLIARHLIAEGEGHAMNAGTPFGDEVCTVSGLREQLRRLPTCAG